MKRKKKNLVHYSDSEVSDKEIEKIEKKSKFQFTYPINLEGNFPSFIYIDIQKSRFIENIQIDIIKDLAQIERPTPLNNLHITLSENFYLNLNQISGFLSKIKSKKLISFNTYLYSSFIKKILNISNSFT